MTSTSTKTNDLKSEINKMDILLPVLIPLITDYLPIFNNDDTIYEYSIIVEIVYLILTTLHRFMQLCMI